MLSLSQDWSKLGVEKDQVVDYNNAIDKIGRVQNILHVISNLPIGDNGFKGGNSINVINSDKLINLFTDMEEMAADALIIYDGFKITPPVIDSDSDLLLHAIKGFKDSEISEVLICANLIKERKDYPGVVLNKNQNN